MGVAFEDMADLVNSTYQAMKPGSLTQIAQTYQDYPFVRYLFDDKMIKKASGRSIAQNIQKTGGTNSAYHTQPHGDDVLSIEDVTDRQDVPWRRTTVPITFDEYEDILNSGDEELFSLMKSRDMRADLDMCELVEETIHTKPASSADKKTPWGLPMFIVKNATEGFNGGNPTGFSSVAGIDRSLAVNAKLKNWTGTYVGFDFSDTGIVEKLAKMCNQCGWRPPLPSLKGPGEPTGMDRMFLTTETAERQLARLLRKQNENLGNDLDPYGRRDRDESMAKFRGAPIVWVPQYDSGVAAVTDNQIMMVDFKWIYPVVTKGVFMVRKPAERHPTKHNTMVVFKDLQWNIWGENFRRMGIIYQA